MAVKKADRRQQVRQQRTERTVPIWRRLHQAIGLIPLLMCALFFAASTMVALYGTHAATYDEGQKIDQPIYAEVDFQIPDEQETLRRQQAARASAPSHYRVNHELIARIGTQLQDLYHAVQAAETFDAFRENADNEQASGVDEAAYEKLRSYADDQAPSRFEQNIGRLRVALQSEYTWNRATAGQRNPPSTAEFILVHSGPPGQDEPAAKEVGVFNLNPISNVTSLRRAADELARRFAPELRSEVSRILAQRMSQDPMLTFELAATNNEMSRRQELVEPATMDYQRGQPLIGARTDRGLTAADLQILAFHAAAYRKYLDSDDEGAKTLRDRELFQRVGIATVFVLITIGLFGYVGMYQHRIFEVHARLLALVALVLGTLLAARLIDTRTQIQELIYAPPLFAASVLAIAYSRRFAVGAMAFVAVMIMLSIRGDGALLITLMIGVAATVYMLNEIRTRTRLLWVGAISAGAIFLAATAFRLVDGQALSFAVQRGCWAAGGALLSAMLVQAALPLIERTFRIATSLSLLEWRDPTRPLLQRLAREAPGTHTHSLAMGALAESACEAIGANGLLAQVAALYHDIGKLHKPEYFSENQEAHINRHDNLAPTMSLLIIIGHVKDGIEMAKEYRLPRVLHQFIEEHHGTTVVRYFHHIASEKQPRIASGRHDREVPEARFRYPGPKPRSKESAILMICDGCEGTVRALSEATTGRIEQAVHQLITDRLNDGQFDNCDITLRELHRVEESLVKSLCGHYHGRVAYPKREKAEPAGTPESETERKSIAG